MSEVGPQAANLATISSTRGPLTLSRDMGPSLRTALGSAWPRPADIPISPYRNLEIVGLTADGLGGLEHFRRFHFSLRRIVCVFLGIRGTSRCRGVRRKCAINRVPIVTIRSQSKLNGLPVIALGPIGNVW